MFDVNLAENPPRFWQGCLSFLAVKAGLPAGVEAVNAIAVQTATAQVIVLPIGRR